MFEIGFWELVLVFALGLIVLGPEKLPKVAAKLGRYAGQARRMARTLSAQVRDELEAEEFRARQAEAQRKAAAAGRTSDGSASGSSAGDASTDGGATVDAAGSGTPKASVASTADSPPAAEPATDLAADGHAGATADPSVLDAEGVSAATPRWNRPGMSDLIPSGEASGQSSGQSRGESAAQPGADAEALRKA